jgi:murein L,D-transpeptidase YafK
MTLSLPRLALAAAALLALAACNETGSGRNPARAYAPIPGDTLALFSQKATDRSAPIILRAYKKESEIELWKQAKDGRYVHVKTYPVCRWSGQLGPKKREGDRQVPEGFYTVTPAQMNPNSAYWLSFNVGYPNPMERAMGRGGGDIMVHGTCSSRGCFAMTDKQIEEIYAVMREAFNGGQKSVQFQSYPFRMTPDNLARFRHDPNIAFWKNLKEGNDNFEVTKVEPRVGYCGGKYVFNAESGRNDPNAPCSSVAGDPSIASLVAAKQRDDDRKVAELIQKGTPAVAIRYADGSQNASFRNSGFGYSDDRTVVAYAETNNRHIGEISRPEAIEDVQEIAVDERGQPRETAKTEVATASTAEQTVAAAAPAAPAVAKPAAVAAVSAAKPAAKAVPTAQQVASAQPQPVVPATKPAGSFSAIGALFGSSPAPSEQAETTSTVAKAAASGSKPFYKRWFGLGSEDAAAAPEAPATATPAPGVPVPSKRQAAGEGKAKMAFILPPSDESGSSGQQ